ncbi:ArgE/DapE family deacylase [uncultured Marinococcus sp.]|uniref:ArgE/DapE family deacylase n=1 Tax=uncultured Marinococcus sp. TaxID=487012 RepID=UPI002615B65D|nr:ArgE/DapE family deacylase [uncultured Marinococcus sp.]
MTSEKILRLLQELIQIPSVNPGLCPQEGYNEEKIAIYIVDWLTANDIKARLEYIEGSRPNVVAEVGEDDGPTLCLCAHLDTVSAMGMEIDPFVPRLEAGRVYGRGSCDMKAGIAAIMGAAVDIAEEGNINGKLIVALVCDEEYKSIGAEHFVSKYNADACIITEPTDMKLVAAHKGFLWGKVTTHGKSAHGSRWDLGQSAITKMGPIITALDQFDKSILRNKTHDLLGPASMHVSLIDGGTEISTYAATSEMHFERRTLLSEEYQHTTNEIESVIKDVEEWAHINWVFERKPSVCSLDDFIVQTASSSFQELIGEKPEVVGWDFWTDAAVFQQRDIPSINLGPIGYGLHEPVEWVEFDSMLQIQRVLVDTAKRFLK